MALKNTQDESARIRGIYTLSLILSLTAALVLSFYVVPRLTGIRSGGGAIVLRLGGLFVLFKLIELTFCSGRLQRLRRQEFDTVVLQTRERVQESLGPDGHSTSSRQIARARSSVVNLRRYARPTLFGAGYAEASSVSDELDALIRSRES